MTTPSHIAPTTRPRARRWRLAALALAVVASVAAGCGGGEDDTGAAASDAASEEPQSGGRLVIATDIEAEGLDPANSNLSAGGYTYASAIFDSLMVANEDGEVVPYLAESLEPNADYTTWTMKLRPGVTFHDGTPLDAEAIRLNVEHHLSSVGSAALAGLNGATVLDQLTVTFDLESTWVPFPSYLTGALGLVAAPSMLADPDGASHPVGTGPFVFEEWTRNERLVVTRNPDYWQEGVPYLDEIEFRPIPEFQSRLNALQTGEVDALYATGGDSLAALQEAGGGIQVHQVDEGSATENYVLLNNIVPPFDNGHARRALAYATDVEQLNDVLERGLGELATGPFSGEDAYPQPENLPQYDPERAREELESYRADTGRDLSVELSTSSTARSLQEAELLQDMWGQVGIDVTIHQIEEAQLIVHVLLGDFQAIPWGFDGLPDPDQQTIFWSSGTAAPVGSFAPNFGRFRNERVDDLMAEARRTVDEDQRIAAYAEVAQIIVDEVPWVYGTRQIAVLAARPDVGGLGDFPLPDGDQGVELTQSIIRAPALWRAD
jgi:peptide/nickel transport system substrate-binding protein